MTALIDDVDAIYCPHCAYDLRTLTGASCPECGGTIDRDALKRSQIPWVHRGEIGRIRAFWRTVWWVTFKTRDFCHEIARPVDYPEARKFQHALVRWALGSLAALGLAMTLLLRWNGALALDGAAALGFAVGMGAAALLLGVLLYAVTGVQSYWFHPRSLPVERQNRAVALSYYAGAPLAFLPWIVVWILMAAFILEVGQEIQAEGLRWLGTIMIILGVGTLGALPVACWRVSLVMASAAAQRNGPGWWAMAAALPVTWALLAGLVLVVLPASVVWVWIMFYTL